MLTYVACNLNLMTKESQKEGESTSIEVNKLQCLDFSTSTQTSTAPPLGDQVQDPLLILESENSETDESNDEETGSYSVHDSNSSVGPESFEDLDLDMDPGLLD